MTQAVGSGARTDRWRRLQSQFRKPVDMTAEITDDSLYLKNMLSTCVDDGVVTPWWSVELFGDSFS